MYLTFNKAIIVLYQGFSKLVPIVSSRLGLWSEMQTYDQSVVLLSVIIVRQFSGTSCFQPLLLGHPWQALL